jgi:hypothetical protein
MLTPEQRELIEDAAQEVDEQHRRKTAAAIRQAVIELDAATADTERLVAENVQLLGQVIELSARVKGASERTGYPYYVTYSAYLNGVSGVGASWRDLGRPIRTYADVQELAAACESQLVKHVIVLSWTLLDES